MLQCIERLLTKHLVEDRTNLCVRSPQMRGARYTHSYQWRDMRGPFALLRTRQ